jgi:hypothetical protein
LRPGDYGVGRVAAHAFVIDTHKHAIQQTFFHYVYEPGGNRVEVANAGARLILAPNWKPIVGTEEERKKGQAWGLKTSGPSTPTARRRC